MSPENVGKQFHGSDVEFQPGDRILPRSQTGARENAFGNRDTSQHVTTTAHLPEAARYGKHVYVVQPVGVIGQDPEYGPRGAAHRKHPQVQQTFDSQEAVVVRKVSPEATTRAKDFQPLTRIDGQPRPRSVDRQIDRSMFGVGNREREDLARKARRRRT